MQMYELNRIIPTFDIKLPTCMYTVKNHSLIEINNKTDNSVEMANLEARQEKVFKQLQELKNQLMGIRAQLKLCQKPGPDKSSARSENENKTKQCLEDSTIYEPLYDIVINAHPEYIPYGLLAMKNMWKKDFDINVRVHAHSTIPKLSQDALDFQENITKPNANKARGSINVTLIWKNCEHTEMISSPTMYIPIYGEVNIIRYLGRVGPKEYRYEETNLANEIDIILDICYQLLRCSTAKARLQLLRFLNSRLQKQQYFGGDRICIADVAVYSTLKRTPKTEKDLTENMKKWLLRVKPHTLI